MIDLLLMLSKTYGADDIILLWLTPVTDDDK